jgi:hypothetical protein
VVSARRLSGLCARYKARILVSGGIAEKLEGMPAIGLKKLGVPVDQADGEGEKFYELEQSLSRFG